MKVALCQIEVVCNDREGNLSRIEEALRSANSQGAELTVFPESALLGWVNPEAHHTAEPIPGPDSDRLCGMAQRFGVGMIVGIDEKCGEKLYDSAVAISPDGSLLGVHRKANVLPELMTPPYADGDRAPTVVEFAFGRVGILICADTFCDETIVSLKKANVDLLATPYGWVATEDTWPQHGNELETLICRRAKELGRVVVGVDSVGTVGHGPWMGRRFCGASLAADCNGKALSHLNLAVAHVTVVECPL